MSDFIEIPDGVIRKDLIRKITRYERDKYEGGTYFGVKIETESNEYNFEEFGRNSYFGSDEIEKAQKRRDEKYDKIIKQLGG